MLVKKLLSGGQRRDWDSIKDKGTHSLGGEHVVNFIMRTECESYYPTLSKRVLDVKKSFLVIGPSSC